MTKLSPTQLTFIHSCVALLMFAAGCPAPPPVPTPECTFVDGANAPENVELIRILVAREGAKVSVTGLSSSVPPLAEVEAIDETDESRATTTSADDGRFTLSFDADAGLERLTLLVDGERTGPFRVRDGSAARNCAIGSAIPTGTAANDVVMSRCGETPVAAVPVSTDSALDAVAIATQAAPLSDVGFPLDDDGRGGSPWHVASGPTAGIVAVSLRDQNAVALVDICEGRVLATARSDVPPLITVDPPVTLSLPFDVDGDNSADATVREMLLRAPQGVAVSGDKVVVTFTNFLEAATGDVEVQRLGPGIAVIYTIDDVDNPTNLIESARLNLPFKNPQSLVAAPDGRVWASATGPLALQDGRCCTGGGESGLVAIDANAERIDHVMELTPFVPASPAFVGDDVVVGSLVRAEVRIGPANATTLAALDSLPLGELDVVESVFEVAVAPNGLAFAAVYGDDALWAIDVGRRTIAPPPLDFPLVFGPGAPNFRGLIAADFDENGRGAAVLNLSAEVRPIDLRQVMGP